MTGGALFDALRAWIRRPRELALANGAAFCAVFLPATSLPFLRGAARWPALGALALWAWLVFSALCAACVQLAVGAGGPWSATWVWFKGAYRERMASFFAGAAIFWWLAAANSFYRARPAPVWLEWGLFGVLGAAALWLAMALLLSLGVSAEGGRSWKAVWKASALLPLAYTPAALAALAVFALALGVPVLWIGLRHWSARFWLAPLLMAPFFTAAYLAAYLTSLVRAMFDHAEGRPPTEPPSWSELWTPWR